MVVAGTRLGTHRRVLLGGPYIDLLFSFFNSFSSKKYNLKSTYDSFRSRFASSGVVTRLALTMKELRLVANNVCNINKSVTSHSCFGWPGSGHILPQEIYFCWIGLHLTWTKVVQTKTGRRWVVYGARVTASAPQSELGGDPR